jgi:hypothetical protein
MVRIGGKCKGSAELDVAGFFLETFSQIIGPRCPIRISQKNLMGGSAAGGYRGADRRDRADEDGDHHHAESKNRRTPRARLALPSAATPESLFFLFFVRLLRPFPSCIRPSPALPLWAGQGRPGLPKIDDRTPI